MKVIFDKVREELDNHPDRHMIDMEVKFGKYDYFYQTYYDALHKQYVVCINEGLQETASHIRLFVADHLPISIDMAQINKIKDMFDL